MGKLARKGGGGSRFRFAPLAGGRGSITLASGGLDLGGLIHAHHIGTTRAIGGRSALGDAPGTCAMTACSGGVAYRSGSAPVYASQADRGIVIAALGGTPDAGARSLGTGAQRRRAVAGEPASVIAMRNGRVSQPRLEDSRRLSLRRADSILYIPGDSGYRRQEQGAPSWWWYQADNRERPARSGLRAGAGRTTTSSGLTGKRDGLSTPAQARLRVAIFHSTPGTGGPASSTRPWAPPARSATSWAVSPDRCSPHGAGRRVHSAGLLEADGLRPDGHEDLARPARRVSIAFSRPRRGRRRRSAGRRGFPPTSFPPFSPVRPTTRRA